MSNSAKVQRKKGGAAKYGRNKKAADSATSLFVKGLISFEKYHSMKKSH